uniref:HAT C-terminal dimerisation domain-containing protein n=1 Tax=Ditylenchus dipsaci TaxID=166011 RepID=A0A915ELL5_9BILA
MCSCKSFDVIGNSDEVLIGDAIGFWNANSQVYPTLEKVAHDILAIPASSAAVERLFSIMAMHSSGRKTSTGQQLLNKDYVGIQSALINI